MALTPLSERGAPLRIATDLLPPKHLPEAITLSRAKVGETVGIANSIGPSAWGSTRRLGSYLDMVGGARFFALVRIPFIGTRATVQREGGRARLPTPFTAPLGKTLLGRAHDPLAVGALLGLVRPDVCAKSHTSTRHSPPPSTTA